MWRGLRAPRARRPGGGRGRGPHRGRDQPLVGLRRGGVADVHPRHALLHPGRARRPRRRAPRARPGVDRTRPRGRAVLAARASCSCSSPRATTGAPAAADAYAAALRRGRQPGDVAVALAQGGGARRLGRRRGARARARGGRARARVGRAGRARPRAARARHARGRGRDRRAWRRPSPCSTARSRGWSWPRRSPRSARRCGARGGRPTRASRCAARSSWPSACDAPGLADHVRTELYAAGARPRTDALSGAGALTASERRVVDLAAAGETNRDIAQALYVTPKTVEVHLSNAYRKLGVRSRRELPGGARAGMTGLLERDREVAALEALVADAPRGQRAAGADRRARPGSASRACSPTCATARRPARARRPRVRARAGVRVRRRAPAVRGRRRAAAGRRARRRRGARRRRCSRRRPAATATRRSRRSTGCSG